MAERKSSSVFFLLLCGTAVCHISQYVYIPKAMTWENAQEYCRENYVDLATITNDEEHQRLKMAAAGSSSLNGWIGLYRNDSRLNIWQWSDREPTTYFHWRLGQPDNWKGDEKCTMMYVGDWNDAYCEIGYFFYCSWRFVLVKDSKTWEEALGYCRTHYIGLASPISQTQLDLAKNATLQTQTVRMWTGLHFVNGQWLNVKGASLRSLVSLSSCPTPRYRCGAYNTKTQLWETRDCSEKLNFLCY